MKKILILLLLVIIQGCSKSEDKIKNYLESGKSLYEKGNYDKAKIQFKNIILLNNKHSEAYYRLALIDEKKQNWQSMFNNLSQVIRLDPKNNDAILKLGRLNLLSGRQNEAIKNVETVLKTDPNNPDALALKGAVFVKQEKMDDAMALAEQILKQHPDHTDAISLKTVIHLTKNDPATAITTVEKALQLKPDDLSLLLLKLQVHSQIKDLAAVEQDYFDLIKRFPENFEFTYSLVKHYSDIGQEDKALEKLQTLIDTHPDELKPKLVLLDYLMQKRPEQVEKTLAGYLAQYPDDTDLLFRSVAVNVRLNKNAEAKQALNKIIELKPKTKEGLSAKIMLAKMAFQENDTELAQNLAKEVLSEDKNNLDAALMKARLDLQKGLTDEAIANLRVVLRDFTNSEEALVLMGQAYLKKNSPELADENFRKALAVNPANFEALMPVVSTLIKNNETTRAEELLTKALAEKPDHSGALQAMAQVKLMQKDWAGSQKVADLIGAKPKGAGFAKFLGGKISETQGLCKEAVGQYKEALTLSPDLTDALHGMANCYGSLKQMKEMYAYLEEFIAAHPEEKYPWLLKGQLLTNDKTYDAALKVLTEATGKWPKIPEFYEAIANVYLQQKDNGKAVAIINKGIAEMPGEIRLALFLASIYEQTADYSQALKLYEALFAKNPNVDLIVNNLVSLLLEHFNTKENVDRAVNLAKRFERSDQPYFVDSYGWALYNSGKYDEALQILRETAKKMPEAPVFRYHLGAAYYKTKNNALAITELEEALKAGEKAGDFTEKKAVEELLNTIRTKPAG